MTDVAQLVLRSSVEEDYEYFMARRTSDGYWEWIGGKAEEGEEIEGTAVRELEEELRVDWTEYEYSIEGVAEAYPSRADSKYMLNPVLIEVEPELIEKLEQKNLSREHDDLDWFRLTEFDEYETRGQYEALERLDLVEGDVALAAVRDGEDYLVVERSEENTSSGRWGFVSGKIEEGENAEEAAVRELREEVDLEAEVIETGDFYIGKGELGYWRLFPVLLETEDREVDLNWELSDHRWVGIRELEGMRTMGKLKALEKLDVDYE